MTVPTVIAGQVKPIRTTYNNRGYTQGSQNNQTTKAIPMPNLGGLGEDQATTNVESDLLIAAGMPKKLDYPYLVVYTDIVRNSVYYGGDSGHQKMSAIAYIRITRNYAEGDYFHPQQRLS